MHHRDDLRPPVADVVDREALVVAAEGVPALKAQSEPYASGRRAVPAWGCSPGDACWGKHSSAGALRHGEMALRGRNADGCSGGGRVEVSRPARRASRVAVRMSTPCLAAVDRPAADAVPVLGGGLGAEPVRRSSAGSWPGGRHVRPWLLVGGMRRSLVKRSTSSSRSRRYFQNLRPTGWSDGLGRSGVRRISARPTRTRVGSCGSTWPGCPPGSRPPRARARLAAWISRRGGDLTGPGRVRMESRRSRPGHAAGGRSTVDGCGHRVRRSRSSGSGRARSRRSGRPGRTRELCIVRSPTWYQVSRSGCRRPAGTSCRCPVSRPVSVAAGARTDADRGLIAAHHVGEREQGPDPQVAAALDRGGGPSRHAVRESRPGAARSAIRPESAQRCTGIACATIRYAPRRRLVPRLTPWPPGHRRGDRRGVDSAAPAPGGVQIVLEPLGRHQQDLDLLMARTVTPRSAAPARSAPQPHAPAGK